MRFYDFSARGNVVNMSSSYQSRQQHQQSWARETENSIGADVDGIQTQFCR